MKKIIVIGERRFEGVKWKFYFSYNLKTWSIGQSYFQRGFKTRA